MTWVREGGPRLVLAGEGGRQVLREPGVPAPTGTERLVSPDDRYDEDCRLELEDAETGERLTRRDGESPDIEHPKLFELTTGCALEQWPELHTGCQGSSIIHHLPPSPPFAMPGSWRAVCATATPRRYPRPPAEVGLRTPVTSERRMSCAPHQANDSRTVSRPIAPVTCRPYFLLRSLMCLKSSCFYRITNQTF